MTASKILGNHERLEAVAAAAREHEKQLKKKFELHASVYGEGAPYFSEATAPFWAAIRDGHFFLSHCKCCGHVYFPPRVICPDCWAADAGELWPTAGEGRLITFTDLYVTAPRLKDLAPIRMAVVDLEEGVRILTWLRGPGAMEAKAGLPCRIVVERILDQDWFVAIVDPASQPAP